MATMKKPPRKFLDQVREALRLKHYSIRIEEAYVVWIKLTKDEALRVIEGLSGLQQLMAQLLLGSGLRLLECVWLRVKMSILPTVRSSYGMAKAWKIA
jgi:hypothetical protein